MTFLIGLDTTRPIHRAAADNGGSCAFTGNPLGYGCLLKWAKSIAASEPLLFALNSTGQGAAALLDWLSSHGLDVRWMPVQVR